MKKKLILIAMLFAFTLSGCGSDSNSNSDTTEAVTEIKNGTYEIAGSDFSYHEKVNNDTTGNWRYSVTVTAGEVTEYAVEYYNTLFADDSEVHAVINKGLNTTNKINVLSDDQLLVTVYDYVEDEEYDAKKLFGGTLLGKYQITISTGEIVDLNDDAPEASETSEAPETESTDAGVSDGSKSAADEADLTMGQKNALKKADDYLSFTAFSYSGLIEQLEFEGYSTEEATYAADNCGADWNEQAAKKAQDYLDMTAFSREGLIEQLEFDGFTSEQAEYAVTQVGY